VSLKQRAHRALWQRLPRGLRRAALFRASAWMAPRPTPTAAAAKPVIVAGSLSTASGLGNSARLCHDALMAAGLPVLGIDLTGCLMQPADFPGFAFSDGGGIEGPGTLVVHVNAPLMALAMLRLGRRLVRDKRIVGYWAWELPEAPAEWRHGAAFVHEVWVPSAFTAEAVRPVAADVPVRVVPHPVATHHGGPFARKAAAEGPFTALTIFDAASSFARKNPCAAIRAFRLAFGDDEGARLVVKSTRLSSFPGARAQLEAARGDARNIVVIDATVSLAQLDALYAQADVVVSLHRSEGFGLVIAEGMLRGLPVIATDWSGNRDFLKPETGIPIACDLVPACDPQGTYHHPQTQWADANVAEAAAALRRLRDDPNYARRLGRHAAEFAAGAFGAEAYAEAVRRRLGW
jgi:glycosyltransferase involved in cell wall biosynthesis